jgi:CRP/FNR family transcriptional regulator, cyclic AMP receptor protein
MGIVARAIPLPLVYPPSSWLAHLQRLTGGSVRRLDPGEVLLHQGERSSCLWLLQSGAVALASTAPSGKRATLAVVGPEAVLGEHGLVGPLIDPRQRGPSMLPEAIALIASTVQAIPLSGLRAAMASDPYVAWWLAAAVSWRANQVERALARVLALRVPQRVLGALQDLALEFGHASPGALRIGLPLTQDLLASMAGATRESVNRAIAELEEQGLVRRMGPSYELPVGGGAS